MGGEAKLVGPDLSNGVAAGDVPDGGVLVGHAGGEAVLLARRGAEVFAVGATCTHYGGPLGEGAVVGDEVRCPWHHACFSLRTGEPVRAPALNPVPCFDIESRGGRLFVLGKREQPPPPDGTAPAAPERGRNLDGTAPAAPERRRDLAEAGRSSIVIVGAGAAGNACAEALRREGHTGKISILGAEGTVPVDRPNLSKDYLAGNAPEEWIPLRDEDFYRSRRIEVALDSRVVDLRLAEKRVLLGGGGSVAFDALVLATGANPVRLPVPGGDAPHVFTLRTLADSRAIIARAKTAKCAALLGAGFIGLEVAASLRARGVEVHVIAPEAVPLGRVLGDSLGGFVRKIHERHGVVFHLGTTAKSIAPGNVEMANGHRIPADLVVMGVGVRPEVSLAERAGLAVDRGVVVDAYLRTSAPDVWAVGDVARWPDPRSGENIRVEHWVVAERMGQIAARNVLGLREACDLVPFFWSAHYDVTINYVGHAETWDRIDVDGTLDARDAAVAFRRKGVTLAVATIGRDRAALEVESAMQRRDEAALRRIVGPA